MLNAAAVEIGAQAQDQSRNRRYSRVYNVEERENRKPLYIRHAWDIHSIATTAQKWKHGFKSARASDTVE